MRLPIKCRVCRRGLGWMDPPSLAEIRAMLAGSPFAALTAFLPSNVTEELARLPLYLCDECDNFLSLGEQ